MVQIIKEKTFGSEFGKAFGTGLGQGIEKGYEKATSTKEKMAALKKENEDLRIEDEAIEKAVPGFSLRGIKDPKRREQLLSEYLKGTNAQEAQTNKFNHENELENKRHEHAKELAGQKFDAISKDKGDKLAGEKTEKDAPYIQALDTIKRMREIGSSGNLGRGSAVKGFFGGQTAKDRGEYEQLGKSLISLSSTIPIRNKAEFETLAHNLYDPSIPDDQREGILAALERIIQGSLSQTEGTNAFPIQQNNVQKERPPLSSFHR